MFFIYYCFDDKLAQIFNNPVLGNIEWYYIFALSVFFGGFTIKVKK